MKFVPFDPSSSAEALQPFLGASEQDLASMLEHSPVHAQDIVDACEKELSVLEHIIRTQRDILQEAAREKKEVTEATVVRAIDGFVRFYNASVAKLTRRPLGTISDRWIEGEREAEDDLAKTETSYDKIARLLKTALSLEERRHREWKKAA